MVSSVMPRSSFFQKCFGSSQESSRKSRSIECDHAGEEGSLAGGRLSFRVTLGSSIVEPVECRFSSWFGGAVDFAKVRSRRSLQFWHSGRKCYCLQPNECNLATPAILDDGHFADREEHSQHQSGQVPVGRGGASPWRSWHRNTLRNQPGK